VIFQRFEVPGLSHYSYMVGCGGVVAVIDPKRDIDTYLDYADSNDLRIGFVLETHIHADYASGARALAEAAGAELCLSAYDQGEIFEVAFPHRELHGGDEITIGSVVLRTVHTPGHTPEHISFLLTQPACSAEPIALFSGDFLFIGSVGRPDLLGEAEKHALARSLYRSVRQLANLPDGLLIFPGHGAGSLCGSGMSQRDQSTLGYERASNPFLQPQSEAAFVDAILGSVPELPDYYRRMKRVNSAGPTILVELPGRSRMTVGEFEARQKDAVVVDLRRPEAFGGAHIPGSYNIGAGSSLGTWAAWMLPYDTPILLVGDESTDLDEARRCFIRVGMDAVVGVLRGGMAAWIAEGKPQAHLAQVSVGELQEALDGSAKLTLLDVRSPSEWKSGHLGEAIHIPCGELGHRIVELPKGGPLYVICGSGYRSSLAASVLARTGRSQVMNVNGGMSAWKKRAPAVFA
jgi:hydroxyacylglutathione hydrolase